jgi:hypothetical protein
MGPQYGTHIYVEEINIRVGNRSYINVEHNPKQGIRNGTHKVYMHDITCTKSLLCQFRH